MKEEYAKLSRTELEKRLALYEDSQYNLVYQSNLDIIYDFSALASSSIKLDDEDAEKKLNIRIKASEAANNIIKLNSELRELMNPAMRALAEQMDIGFAEKMSKLRLERLKQKDADMKGGKLITGNFKGGE